MRWLALPLLGLGLALSACSSGGTSAVERLAPVIQGLIFGSDDVPDPEPVPRSVLLQIPFATIALQVRDGPIGYATAQEANGPYVVYQDAARRSVTILGGLITGTSGIGRNMKAIKNQVDDPIAVQTPLDAWPKRVDRNYQFARHSAEDFEITVSCGYQQISRERIEIFEIFYSVTRVVERCSNGIRTFDNTYWVDADNGFIWQSEQWVGPQIEPYTLRILRPFVG